MKHRLIKRVALQPDRRVVSPVVTSPSMRHLHGTNDVTAGDQSCLVVHHGNETVMTFSVLPLCHLDSSSSLVLPHSEHSNLRCSAKEKNIWLRCVALVLTASFPADRSP